MSSKKDKNSDKMEKIISLCKRRGFIYQGSEIYGGLAGTWDYGPLGVALRKNVEEIWWKMFVDEREDVYGIDAAILMNGEVWKASGHVDSFSDPLVEDKKTKKRYRADTLLENAGIDPAGMGVGEMTAVIKENKIKSPDGNELGEVNNFKMMFETKIGAAEDGLISYLRPETAGGIFVNFKNVVDSFHPKLPFGIAQIGKAFRNEIAPRDFLFRTREFRQMEIEYFVRESDWEKSFQEWRDGVLSYIGAVGLPLNLVHEIEVSAEKRAHYSKRTIDFEFDFPFGQKELYGLAYRGDYDLGKHKKGSGMNIDYVESESGQKILPHVIEPSLGVERTILAILTSAYQEDDIGGEKREVLKLLPKVAPIKVAVFPLLKNKPELVKKAREVYEKIKAEIPQTMFDDNGNIGKRYRRQDEIGTPYCVTVDFETIEKDNAVTLRNRDDAKQVRVTIDDLLVELKKKIS